jgi:hypothetical protein
MTFSEEDKKNLDAAVVACRQAALKIDLDFRPSAPCNAVSWALLHAASLIQQAQAWEMMNVKYDSYHYKKKKGGD